LGIFKNMTKMKYMVYFIHYEELYIFLTFNRKKLQQLRNILIYISDRNSIQIITCRRSMKKTIIR
ncbi:hypothetical protein DW972_12575, partial [Anaerobutyricum hallii]